MDGKSARGGHNRPKTAELGQKRPEAGFWGSRRAAVGIRENRGKSEKSSDFMEMQRKPVILMEIRENQ